MAFKRKKKLPTENHERIKFDLVINNHAVDYFGRGHRPRAPLLERTKGLDFGRGIGYRKSFEYRIMGELPRSLVTYCLHGA